MQRFIALVSKKMAGEASGEELAELDSLLQSDEELRERYRILQQYFQAAAHGQGYDTELALQRTLARIHGAPEETAPRRRPLRRLAWMSAAAAVAALLLYTGYMSLQKKARLPKADKTLVQWQTRQNGKGIRSVISLPDGSRIWLNADSRLTYPEAFTGAAREVHLKGEAFFDVAARPAQPFIIRLDKGTVQVLGTSFNVRAYDNEPVQTSVSSGKVAFIPKYAGAHHRQDTIYITPDTKVTYTQSTGSLVKQPASGAEDRAWTEGRLIFRAATLEQIAAQLERAFGKKVVFRDEAPRHYILTGSFQNNSLEDIMYYLAKTKDFHYAMTDTALVISE